MGDAVIGVPLGRGEGPKFLLRIRMEDLLKRRENTISEKVCSQYFEKLEKS